MKYKTQGVCSSMIDIEIKGSIPGAKGSYVILED